MRRSHTWKSLMLLAVLEIGNPVDYGQSGAALAESRMDQGQKIFLKHCTACHGIEGKGDGYRLLGPDPANLTASAIRKKSDGVLLNTIHEGKSTMPSWNGRLSEQDSRDVLAYIRTLSK